MDGRVSFFVSLDRSKRPTHHRATPGAVHPHALLVHPAVQFTASLVLQIEGVEGYVVQDGPAVYKAAVIGMAEVTEDILKRNDMTAADLAWLVPHQADRRIIEAVAKRLGLGLDRVIINLHRYGNTVAATIPMALSEWERAWGLRARRPRRLVGLRGGVHRRQRLSALGDRLARSTFRPGGPSLTTAGRID
jgi:hypothetical protein